MDGNVDTYTIASTNGIETIFTVTNGKDGINGKDGVGIGSAIDDNGMRVLILTNGTKLNMGKFVEISDDTIPASGAVFSAKSNTDTTAVISLVVAAIAMLSHLGCSSPCLKIIAKLR